MVLLPEDKATDSSTKAYTDSFTSGLAPSPTTPDSVIQSQNAAAPAKENLSTSPINALPSTPHKFFNTEKYGLLIGRPHNFLRNADYQNRVFSKHMMNFAPLVMIRPGRIRFTEIEKYFNNPEIKKILGISPDTPLEQVTGLDRSGENSPIFQRGNGYGVTQGDLDAVNLAIQKKRDYAGTVYNFGDPSSTSVRYFDFVPKWAEYSSVLSTISGHMFSRLKGEGLLWSKYDTGIKTGSDNLMTFWADNASSVSESISTDVQPSVLSSLQRTLSDGAKQASFLAGSSGVANGENSDFYSRAVQSLSMSVSDGGNGIRASLGDAILGMNPLLPEVWKDTTFGRSYNLSFKFESAYGNPGAIIQNVIMPFNYLVSLVMPVMSGPVSYSEPFIFQIDCPGHFACDLGICTDFSFVKGGSENLWTVDGLPRCIEVNMQVKDLYPAIASSHNNRSMMMNIGLATFLDNMMGVPITKSGSKIDIVTSLKRDINSLIMETRNYPSVVTDNALFKLKEDFGLGRITGIFR